MQLTPPRLSLPRDERKLVGRAVLRGTSVEDPGLAPFAVEYGQWWTRFMSWTIVYWGALACLLVVVELRSHRNLVWVPLAGDLLIVAFALFFRRRYARAVRTNLALISEPPNS
jgi:hypothetical protein